MADTRMFWPITAASSMNARAVTDNRGFRCRYQSAACVSATAAVKARPRQIRETSPGGLPQLLPRWTRAIAGEKTIGRLFGLGRLAFSFGQHLLENTLH